MAFGTHDDSDDVMNEINMTPLVDVMLVLLIIFMITVPVLTHSVGVQLPRATSTPEQVPPQTIRLAVDAQGRYLWNERPLAAADLPARLRAAAAQQPQPELHLRADKDARYEPVAQALAAAQRAGLRRIGFVTEPGAP